MNLRDCNHCIVHHWDFCKWSYTNEDVNEHYCNNGENEFDGMCSCESCPAVDGIFDQCWDAMEAPK
jgi:hypothetical protein